MLLPSVTTILSKTGDKTGLLEWRARVGDETADREMRQASALGNAMHDNLEAHILRRERPRGNNIIYTMAREMADRIIDQFLCEVDEFWGVEVPLYIPELYAGTTDLVGLHKGEPAIMDFKSAKKMKQEKHIEDYKLQLCAYGLAHNVVHGTEINKGVIFMADRKGDAKSFEVGGDEFERYAQRWQDRVVTYFSP